jgi:beta-phosphoglucomutase
MHAPNSEFRYDYVIFDVGSTLIGFSNPAPFQDFLAETGLPSTEEDAHRFHRRFLAVTAGERDKAQGLGADEAALDAWWHAAFQATWPNRPDLAEEMFGWLRAGRLDNLFSDSVPALKALQELGMPMGVVSNFAARLEDGLRRLGLRDFFDFVVTSSLVGMAKPDPGIFDLAVAKTDRPRQRLLYVGDHLGDDVEGARSAGLDAVLIDRRDQRPEAHCPRIESLLDLAPYVQAPCQPAPAIIFDMDGVVLDSIPAHVLSWQAAMKPLGVELTAEDLCPLEGVSYAVAAQRLTEQLFGRAFSSDEGRRLAGSAETVFHQIFQPAFIPGVVPLLHDLHGRGYHLALATGSAQSLVDASLVSTGIADLFETIVTGDQVPQGKHGPEPYQAAASRLGFPPSECLVVENAPIGIQSAKAAGMTCLALETSLPGQLLSSAGADRVFPDIRALRSWLLSRWNLAPEVDVY